MPVPNLPSAPPIQGPLRLIRPGSVIVDGAQLPTEVSNLVLQVQSLASCRLDQRGRCCPGPAVGQPLTARRPDRRRTPWSYFGRALASRSTGRPLHGREDSNLQHAALETAALPVELRPFGVGRRMSGLFPGCDGFPSPTTVRLTSRHGGSTETTSLRFCARPRRGKHLRRALRGPGGLRTPATRIRNPVLYPD